MEKWRAALASGEAFVAEAQVRRADGEYRWFLQRNVPLRDETGIIIKWYGTGIDIEERKQPEDALRNSEQRYRNLVDTTPAFVHTSLPNGDVDFYNRGWLEYVGLPLQDLLGWDRSCFIHPEDVDDCAQMEQSFGGFWSSRRSTYAYLRLIGHHFTPIT